MESLILISLIITIITILFIPNEFDIIHTPFWSELEKRKNNYWRFFIYDPFKVNWSPLFKFLSFLIKKENREAIVGDLSEMAENLKSHREKPWRIWLIVIYEIIDVLISNVEFKIKDLFKGTERKEIKK